MPALPSTESSRADRVGLASSMWKRAIRERRDSDDPDAPPIAAAAIRGAAIVFFVFTSMPLPTSLTMSSTNFMRAG